MFSPAWQRLGGDLMLSPESLWVRSLLEDKRISFVLTQWGLIKECLQGKVLEKVHPARHQSNGGTVGTQPRPRLECSKSNLVFLLNLLWFLETAHRVLYLKWQGMFAEFLNNFLSCWLFYFPRSKKSSYIGNSHTSLPYCVSRSSQMLSFWFTLDYLLIISNLLFF